MIDPDIASPFWDRRERFLIAHKVRGEPAFDVASKVECPKCKGTIECSECDSLGFWWIIPTSGHRAHPWWSDPLDWYLSEMVDVPPMPDSIPDHFQTSRAPAPSRPAFLERLIKASPKAPLKPVPRRGF